MFFQNYVSKFTKDSAQLIYLYQRSMEFDIEWKNLFMKNGWQDLKYVMSVCKLFSFRAVEIFLNWIELEIDFLHESLQKSLYFLVLNSCVKAHWKVVASCDDCYTNGGGK